jgi:hypothetical protein
MTWISWLFPTYFPKTLKIIIPIEEDFYLQQHHDVMMMMMSGAAHEFELCSCRQLQTY